MKISRTIALAVVLSAAGFVSQSVAATVNLLTSQDNTIFQNNVNNTAGGQTQFYSGGNNALSPRRALTEFNIAGNIPAGATITSVNLTLTLSMVAGSGGGGGSGPGGSPTIELHKISGAWGEGTVSTGSGQGDTAQPGDATWNSRQQGSNLWTTPGGDFNPTASGSLQIVGITTGVSYTWTSTPGMVADVQQWLDSPSTNFGWLLFNTTETGQQTFRAFYSKEYTTNLAFRPNLAVTYQIPEPSTFALLAAGVGMVLASRRCGWRLADR